MLNPQSGAVLGNRLLRQVVTTINWTSRAATNKNILSNKGFSKAQGFISNMLIALK